jgi:hypothetical protein
VPTKRGRKSGLAATASTGFLLPLFQNPEIKFTRFLEPAFFESTKSRPKPLKRNFNISIDAAQFVFLQKSLGCESG